MLSNYSIDNTLGMTFMFIINKPIKKTELKNRQNNSIVFSKEVVSGNASLEGFFGKSKKEKLQDTIHLWNMRWDEISTHNINNDDIVCNNVNKDIKAMQEDIIKVKKILTTISATKLSNVKIKNTLDYVDIMIGLKGSLCLPDLINAIMELSPIEMFKDNDKLYDVINAHRYNFNKAFALHWNEKHSVVELIADYDLKGGMDNHSTINTAGNLGFNLQNSKNLIDTIEKTITACNHITEMLPKLKQMYTKFGEVIVSELYMKNNNTTTVTVGIYTHMLTGIIEALWKEAAHKSINGYATHALTILAHITNVEKFKQFEQD